MSKVVFAINLKDYTRLIAFNINSLFGSFVTAINTTKIYLNQFKKRVLLYRHMKEPAIFFLSSIKENSTNIGSITDDGVAHVTNVSVTFSAVNQTKMVLEVEAWYWNMEFCDYEDFMSIGRNGVEITNTRRRFGYSRVDETATGPFNSRAGGVPSYQVHYMTGAGDWCPPSAGLAKVCKCTAAFGPTGLADSKSEGLAYGYTTWALMLGLQNDTPDVNTSHYDKGIIFAFARDTT